MKPTTRFPAMRAFTRAELLSLLAVLALLAALAWPTLAGSRRGTDLAACVNNLRQIGRAYAMWGHDHNDDPPYRVPLAEGGVQGHPLAANTWFQFSWLSNGLAMPRILACPTDLSRRVASDFSASADGGFLNTGYRNNAVSYWIGSDAVRFGPTHLLSGDRNVRLSGFGNCSAGINNVGGISTRPLSGLFWTNNLHGIWGNLLHYDGQVRTYSNQTVTNALALGDDNGALHFVMP